MSTDEEAKLRRFVFERILYQDTRTKSINLFGRIDSTPAILLAEKTSFDIAPANLTQFPHSLHLPTVSLLDRNDVYHWFLASQSSAFGEVKLTLIHPATETHVRKYTHQRLRMVVETGAIYKELVRPYINEKLLDGRLNWVYNILEHNAEQDRIILEDPDEERGFILLPDLKWDRKTAASMYIVAIVQRRDINSIRDLKKRDVPWLRYLKKRIPEGICQNYPDIEEDQLKLYVHYQPSYYHFHIHAVSITHDGGLGQATGKAILLGNLISWLDSLGGGEEAGLDGVELTYFLGEESELFQNVFQRTKEGGGGEAEA